MTKQLAEKYADDAKWFAENGSVILARRAAMTAVRLTRPWFEEESLKYLEKVFGYSSTASVDDLTWECIEENADEHLFDEVLLRLGGKK